MSIYSWESNPWVWVLTFKRVPVTDADAKPIIFSGQMVRAILNGRKSQTRRVKRLTLPGDRHYIHAADNFEYLKKLLPQCPYGVPGDRLWVRETFCLENCREVGYYPPPFNDRPIKHHDETDDGIWWEQPHYRATDPTPELDIGKEDPGVIWKPSIFMPRWASRIMLELTAVRVERVQDISEEDALAEGCVTTPSDGTAFGPGTFTAKLDYMMLWDKINGRRKR